MATINSNLVSVGKAKTTGAVFTAPSGTTLPTDATTDLSSAYISMGYISEDGVKHDISRSSDEYKNWDTSTVLTVQTEIKDTLTMKFISSLDSDVLKMVYGASNVTVNDDGSIDIKQNASELGSVVLVIEMIMNGGKIKRVCVPNAKISEISEITYKADELIGYEVKFTALPDQEGNMHYEYIS